MVGFRLILFLAVAFIVIAAGNAHATSWLPSPAPDNRFYCDTRMEGFDPKNTDTWEAKHFTHFHNGGNCKWWANQSPTFIGIFDICRENRYQVCVPRCGTCERLTAIIEERRCRSDPRSDGGFLGICFSGFDGRSDHIAYSCEPVPDCVESTTGEEILVFAKCAKLDPSDPDYCGDKEGVPPPDPPCVSDPDNPCPPVPKDTCEVIDPCLTPISNHHPLGHHLECLEGETFNNFSANAGFVNDNPNRNCAPYAGETTDNAGQPFCAGHYTCQPELYKEHFSHPGCKRKDTPECRQAVNADFLNNDSGQGRLLPYRNSWRGDCGVGKFGIDKADIFPSRTGCYNPEERFSHTPATLSKGFGFNIASLSPVDSLTPFINLVRERNLDTKIETDMQYAMSNFGNNKPGTPRDDILVEHPLCTIERLMKAGIYEYKKFLRTDVDLRKGGIGYAISCLNQDYKDDFDDFCREYYAPQTPPPPGQPERNQVTRWVWNDADKCWEEDSSDAVIPEIPGEHWMPLATRFRFDPDPATEEDTLGLITGTPIIGTMHSKQQGDLGPYGFVGPRKIDDGVTGGGTKRIPIFKGGKLPGRFCAETDPGCNGLPQLSYDTQKWSWEWEWDGDELIEDSKTLGANLFANTYDDIGPWDNVYNISILQEPEAANPTQAETAASAIFDIRNKGLRQKRMECLKIYIEEYAHKGDCGQIVLESAARHIDMSHCQWAVKHRQRNVNKGVLGMRSEHFDYENMITAGWVGKQTSNDICHRQILAGDGNSPFDGDIFNFLGEGEVPTIRKVVENVAGVDVTKTIFDSAAMQPNEEGMDFRRRGCPMLAPETRFWPEEYFEEICAPNLHVGAARLTRLFNQEDLDGVIGSLLDSIGFDEIMGSFHWLTTDIEDVRSIITFEAPKLPTIEMTLPPMEPEPGLPKVLWSPDDTAVVLPHDAWPLHTGGAAIIPHFRFDFNFLLTGIPDGTPCAKPPFFCEPNKGVPVYLFTLIQKFLEQCNCTPKELAEDMATNPFNLIQYTINILTGSGGAAINTNSSTPPQEWEDLKLIQDDDPSNDPAWYTDADPSNDPDYAPIPLDSSVLMDNRTSIQDDWIDPGFDARDCTHTFVHDAWDVPPDLGIGGFVELFERFMNADGTTEVPAQDAQECKQEDKVPGHICLYGHSENGRARQPCDPAAGADPNTGCPPPDPGTCIFQQSSTTRLCDNTGAPCTSDAECNLTDGRCTEALVCPEDKTNPTISKFFGFQFADESVENFNFSTRLFTFIPNPFDIVGYLAGLSGADVYAPFWCEFQIPFNPYVSVKNTASSAEHTALIRMPVLNAMAFNLDRRPNIQNRLSLEYPFVERIRNGCGPFVHRGSWQEDPHNILGKWMIGIETESRCEDWKGAFGKRVDDPKIVSWRLPRFDYEFIHAFIQCTGPIRKPMAACDTETGTLPERVYDADFGLPGIPLPVDPSICDNITDTVAGLFNGNSPFGEGTDTGNQLDGLSNTTIDPSHTDALAGVLDDLQEIVNIVHKCACRIDNLTQMAEDSVKVIEAAIKIAAGDAGLSEYTLLASNALKYLKRAKAPDKCMDIKTEVPHADEVADVNAACLAITMANFAGYTAEAVLAGLANNIPEMLEKTLKAINEFAQGDVCTAPMVHNWEFIKEETYIDSNDKEKIMQPGQFGFWCNCPEDNMWTTRCREDFCTCQQHVLVTGLSIIANPVAICKDYGPYKRWLGCYYQARAKACPVLTRDISNTYPASNLTHGYAPARWPTKITDEEEE